MYRPPINKILFLDIETVPRHEQFTDMSPRWQELWDKKTEWQRHEDSPQEFYPKRAGVLAEFSKVICISAGYFADSSRKSFRVQSFYGDDEKELLLQFAQVLNRLNESYYLCAHNGREFDYPFLCRRMIANGIPLPEILDIQGSKPWEIRHLDTLVLWRFGDYKNYTSLDLLAATLDIGSPKSDMDGSKVAEVYYREKNMKKIVEYCQADMVAVAQIYLRMCNLPLIKPRQVAVKTTDNPPPRQ
jgi:predicted PolB exonuclease-like 3'-5' exonuclease